MVINIYNRLKTFRVNANLSRKDLAEKVGVNYQTIGYLERGEYFPSLELALKLAKLFQIRVEDIFSLEEFDNLSNLLKTRNNEEDL